MQRSPMPAVAAAFAGRKISASPIAVKAYSLSELGKIYGVCEKTLSKWLIPFENEIGEKRGRYYTVAQVEMIFQSLGLPYWIE